MPVPMKKWFAEMQAKYKNASSDRMAHEVFYRNPLRTMWSNRRFFGSPADGVITTQKRLDPHDDLVNIKGAEISTNDLLGPHKIDRPALVVCIFMSYLDVHWNRTPTECQIERFPLPPIRTANVSMLDTEDALVDGKIKPATMAHMKFNGRVVNKMFAGHMRYTYYLVQIADSDVSKIVPIDAEPVASFPQNERFGQIIFGSMNCLILPLDERYRFKPTCQVGDHVEAGTDTLVEIRLTNSRKT